MTHSRQDISRLLTEHGLSPRRAFGQNFVADANTVRRIARLANVGPDDLVIEIGAGLGSLTLALADTGATVIAIEVDHGIAPVLRQVVADRANVTVVEGDARTTDWQELVPPGRKAVVVANLPYNVATPLIADLLDTVPQIHRFVVMVQKEVALRLAASAGSSDYGAISVKVAYWATARLLGDVPPTVFVPQPKVTSSIIEITRRDNPAVDVDPRELFALVRTAFGQRRKMLRRSLANVVDAADFDRAGISPTARPEELDVVTWGRLARTVHETAKKTVTTARTTPGTTTVLEAPAKLTLSLRITGVRDDGYHLIDAVMTSLDLCDEIRVSNIA
ncbi:MAG: 16S rRNA (adenine(1518)-N(6)/adenine(1519)-N(6))-dimethyltransferase RsmA, partial [Actinomycetota bacterium]